ncbi:MAG: PIN domain-containing protein [Clostridiales bacterium]|nr:PIN domain-containing protein [Clostridiales bacterium]
MNVLLDTCVIIDAMQNREPFANDAMELLECAAVNKINGYITAKSVTDVYYIIHRHFHDNEKTREIVQKLINLLIVLDTCAADCKLALLSEVSDYEDAVMIETAKREGMDCIVTRNVKDYSKASIKVMQPSELLKEIDY